MAKFLVIQKPSNLYFNGELSPGNWTTDAEKGDVLTREEAVEIADFFTDLYVKEQGWDVTFEIFLRGWPVPARSVCKKVKKKTS